MLHHLSRLGSTPNPSVATHFHYQLHPILAHELEEATYEFDVLSLRSIVEWLAKQPPPPPPAVVHINMRSPDRTQVYCRKGWSTRVSVGLKAAVPGI